MENHQRVFSQKWLGSLFSIREDDEGFYVNQGPHFNYGKHGRKFFSLQDLNDTEFFRIFYHKADEEWGHRLERFISQELHAGSILQN